LPGSHILSVSGCSHAKCIFCVEQGRQYEVRPVEDVISEIEECKSLGFKEVFDDSATFPTGQWLDDFLRSYGRLGTRLPISCNARISSNGEDRFKDLRNCGFRMLLFGIESANQVTLDKINKGVKSEDIIPTIRRAARAGISCHGAFMFGYPWETDEDAIRTLSLAHYLLRKGYLQTAQASLYCSQGVPGNQAHKKYIKKIYDVGFSPGFWWVRRNEDIGYLTRGVKAWYQSLSVHGK
jgi:radical SAM superfamily enzyme YgiQ (UPF0313 family)